MSEGIGVIGAIGGIGVVGGIGGIGAVGAVGAVGGIGAVGVHRIALDAVTFDGDGRTDRASLQDSVTPANR